MAAESAVCASCAAPSAHLPVAWSFPKITIQPARVLRKFASHGQSESVNSTYISFAPRLASGTRAKLARKRNPIRYRAKHTRVACFEATDINAEFTADCGPIVVGVE